MFMSETTIKPKKELATVTKDQLPVVIESGLKPVYIHDIYTGKPGLIVILSVRFNELVRENAVMPDFSALEEIGFKVSKKEFSTSSRSIVESLNRKAVKDKRNSLILESENGRDLIEDLAFKGFENTLLPIIAKIESDMEKQLDAEITRLQKLKQSGPQ